VNKHTRRMFSGLVLTVTALAQTGAIGRLTPRANASTLPTTSVFTRYLNPNSGTHWVTTGPVTGTYYFEETLGSLLTPPAANTQALYDCLAGTTDHFVSPSANCEGRTVLSLNGYIFTVPPSDVASVQQSTCSDEVALHGWGRGPAEGDVAWTLLS
jgi:hypothetical protein